VNERQRLLRVAFDQLLLVERPDRSTHLDRVCGDDPRQQLTRLLELYNRLSERA
jgi:hypothetical protein